MKTVYYLAFAALLLPLSLMGQSLNDNTVLLGRFTRPNTNFYSDVWGYAANNMEFALLGTATGTSIIDVTDPARPKEVAFIPGPRSIWRDIKTHSHYAYVVHDANNDNHPEPGLQIIDLSNLPNSATLVNTYRATLGPGTAHNLYIDDGYAYVAGSYAAGGVHILDLSDPTQPVEVGTWSESYWHDVVVQNDTLYGSAMFIGAIEIVDATDKSNLKLIARKQYPDAFTHNTWISEDNRYLSQTDERHGRPVNFWDLTDHRNPELIARYWAAPNAIAHNTHLRGNYAFISYYYDGLRIVDISQRRAPVDVGYYDTYPDDQFKRGAGFEGAWGAYPFLPSGHILISDMKYGLFIIEFDTLRAGHIHGTILDKDTGQPLSDVQIDLLNRQPNEGRTEVKVGQDGSYIIGARPGERQFRFSKFGYMDTVITTTVEPGMLRMVDVPMQPRPKAQLSVVVRDDQGQGVAQARIVARAAGLTFYETTNDAGEASFTLPVGSYEVGFYLWGYLPQVRQVNLTFPAGNLEFQAVPGYLETFTEAFDWSYSAPDDDSAHQWFVAAASDAPFGGRLPREDHTGDEAGMMVFGRARYGRSTLTSPVFDATRLNNPVLQFARFYNPYRWATIQANDTLKVYLSNDLGQSWVLIDSYTSIDYEWQVLTYPIKDYLPVTKTMLLRFVNIEGPDVGDPRGSAFCALDDIQIVSEETLTGIVSRPPMPDRLMLLPNYPNPFNPATTIAWYQPRAGSPELIITNILGQNVKHIRLTNTSAGHHTMTVNLGTLPSGVYFYHIQMNGRKSVTRKMLLIR